MSDKYIEIKEYGDICVAEEDVATSSLRVYGDVSFEADHFVAGDLHVNGDMEILGDLNYARDGLTLSDSLTLTSGTSNILLTGATNSKIEWTTADDATNHGYLLFYQESEFVGGDPPGENARLSIGVINNIDGTSDFRDGMDLQGGGRLVLNAGTYDSELGQKLFAPSPEGVDARIEFRINNEVKASLLSSGDIDVAGDLELGSGTSEIRFPNAMQSKIWWTSESDKSDHGYLLYLSQSEYVRDDAPAEQNARLSIGVLNNADWSSTFYRDGMDLQGGARLVLNVGSFDDELAGCLNSGPPAANNNCDIEFRINNVVTASVRNDGLYASGFSESSDASLKTDVKPIEKSLEKLLSLQGVLYRWRDRPPDSPYQIGLIAQAVEPYFPEVVVTDINGIKSVKYSRLVAPLIEGVKRLSTEIARLGQEMAALKKEVSP